MNVRFHFIELTILACLASACAHRPEPPRENPSAASSSPATVETMSITLPILDALLADNAFAAELKSKVGLTDEQVAAVRKISSDEVAKLRTANAENQAGDAEAARTQAVSAIRDTIGADKAAKLLTLASDRWSKGADDPEAAKNGEPEMLKGPNAVPPDTRIVVNIPAFRMDLFQDGKLVKSYKVGIGYPQFPLPQGLRKAQQIIFNPTWTPPDEPWVASMNMVPGEVIEAGSKQNPLGPIKIPIGAPSLIHGGKPLSKIGTFASHGCVGLTSSQVKDFAKLLADVSHTDLSAQTMAAYLKRPNRTQAVKLKQLVPVELRYETIVVEDGKLHIYRDVYDQHTNTEENLRAVLEAHGVSFEAFSEEEKRQALEALNLMSRYPKKQSALAPTPAANQNAADKAAASAARKAEAARLKKMRTQKEIVIDVQALLGKGYPAPVNLDAGAGSQTASAR